MARRSLAECLEGFRRYGDETAVAIRRGYRTVRWSYRRIAEIASQFARELEARGVARGDRVFLWGENRAEWIAAFWGCILRGAIAVPMDAIASNDFALRVCREVDAKLVVCPRERAQLFSGLSPALPVMALETLAEDVARHDGSPLRTSSERADTAEILFTSGTTADPKGVVISHGNILANIEPIEAAIDEYRRYERFVHPLRFLNMVPLSHVFGQMMGIFIPPLLGGTVVFEESLNPSEVIRAIRRERVSVLVAVPRMLASLQEKIQRDHEAEGRLDWLRAQLDAAGKEKFWWRWWRFRQIHRRFGWKFWAVISGGARLDAEMEAFWVRLGYAAIQGYGLTETTSLISLNHPFRSSRGSIGQVLPGREIKLDESGEILVRGESISSGYWKGGYWKGDHGQGREPRPIPGNEGWFATGDLGEFDAKGNLFFKGRKKNVIVTAEGMNLYPDDLEAALRREPEVRDCAVIAVERDGREEPCAVLILHARPDPPPGASGQELLSDEAVAESIVQRANQSLAEYQRMRRWYVWPSPDFPRSSTQKPRLAEIRQAVMASHDGGRPPAPASGATLSDLIHRVTGRRTETVSPDSRLETDLNLSSMERVELMGAIEDRYQIDLNESNFTAATTLGDLSKMLDQPPPRRSDYRYPRWAQRWPVALLRIIVHYLLVRPSTALLACPRVRGRRNLQGLQGPVLVVSNHVTSVDIGWVLFALPSRFRNRIATAMAGERLFGMRRPPRELNWLRRVLDRFGYFLVVALFNVFPLPKLSGFRESFQFAGESIDRGYSILIFPEGELTKDGAIAPFRAGIGVLAAQLNVPVVPMRIDGLFELREAHRMAARPGHVKVTIGSPMRFDPQADPAQIARELHERITAL